LKLTEFLLNLSDEPIELLAEGKDIWEWGQT